MMYAICLLSVVPVRAMDTDRSEQVTQLLFGDIVHILDKKEKWSFIQTHSDKYQGWVSSGQLTSITVEEHEKLLHANHSVTADAIQTIHNLSGNYSFYITAGSSLYNCRENEFEIAGQQYHIHGKIRQIKGFEQESLREHAMIFLHSPYQWGGKSSMGIDCSGFTQIVFKMAGKQLHRDASQQATQGEMIHLINEARTGDLLFFDNENGDIIHTGIMLDNMQIIHAHQKVRIDKVDHMGIFNVDTRQYSHKLRVIKRIN